MKKNLLFVCLCLWSLSMDSQTRKVLIIGIDGCRPDVLMAANTPFMDDLMANGTYSMDAVTEAPTWSGHGWSSMLTGVWQDKHGVTDNTFLGLNFGQYPHFFSHLEAVNASLNTASIVHWAPLNLIVTTVADHKETFDSDAAVKQAAVDHLLNSDPDVLFVDFDDVDGAGHASGFGFGFTQYWEAIETTDGYVGEIIQAMESRSTFGQEEWLVLLSTDHGGNEAAGHGTSELNERDIFFIASGENVTNQEMSRGESSSVIEEELVLGNGGTYIQVAHNQKFDFGSTQDFTLECWVKTNGLSGDAAILSNKNWNSGSNKGFVISTPSANTSIWKVNVGDGIFRADIEGGTIDDGMWHHLAVTFDRDGLMKAYQDGVIVGREGIQLVGDINSGLDLGIGQDGTGSYGVPFEGAIAEVRVWTGVLSENEIAEYAGKRLDSNHPQWANLIGHWPVNENSGLVINDLGPNSLEGSLEGGSAVWNTGLDSLTTYDYSQTPRIVDVAVTALEHLCVPIDPSWELDGKAWSSECESVSIADASIRDKVVVFPIPGTDKVHIRYAQNIPTGTLFTLMDKLGKAVPVSVHIVGNVIQVQRKTLATGVYFLKSDHAQFPPVRIVFN